MKEFVLSKRYARALLKVATEEKNIAKVNDGLQGFAQLCTEKGVFFHWLTCEEIGKKKREIALIDVSKAMRLPVSLQNFFLLLIVKERIKFLPMIAKIFSDLSDDAMNMLKGRLEAADKGEAEEAAKVIEAFLHKKTKKDVRISARRLPQLIAGARLQIKNNLWDASVKKRLQDMEKML